MTDIRKTHTLNLGTSLIEMISKDKANKLEGKPFNLSSMPKVNAVWKESSGFRLRKQLARALSKKGKMALMVLKSPMFGDTIMLMDVIVSKRVSNRVIDVTLTNGSTHIQNGIEYPVYTQIKKVLGGWNISEYYELVTKTDNKEIIVEQVSNDIYTTNIKPFEIFYNNENGTGDIEDVLAGHLVNELTEYSNLIGKSYEYGKDILVNNAALTDKTKNELQDDIEGGESIVDATSFDDKMGGGLTNITQGMGTMQTLISLTTFLENKILQYCGTFRDTIDSGSNSHNLEIALANQYAFEYLQSQLEIRKIHYNNFFNNLALSYNETFKPVKVRLSQLEEIKLKLLQSELVKNKAPMVQSKAYKKQTETQTIENKKAGK